MGKRFLLPQSLGARLREEGLKAKRWGTVESENSGGGGGGGIFFFFLLNSDNSDSKIHETRTKKFCFD